MLKIQEFIINNKNWKEILSEKPYCIKIVEDEHCYLLKYSQIDSDFNNEIVRECRGIILYKDDFSVACHPFHKFGNYGESYVPDIDWNSARYMEKLDGSLIKLWFNFKTDVWQWSTNGTLNAFEANLAFDEKISFGVLIMSTLSKMGINFDSMLNFDKNTTTLFELCTPLNRVVVPHSDYKLYYLMTKNNKTGVEVFNPPEGFPTPKFYSFKNLDDAVNSAKVLPFNDEGYVVVDKYFNRLKVKSPAYVAVHHLKGEGDISKKRILDLIRLNEDQEFLNYFPEYTDFFNDIKDKYNKYINKTKADLVLFNIELNYNEEMKTRKDKALYIVENCINPAIMFQLLDNKISSVQEGIDKIPTDKLITFMEKIK